MAHTRLQPLISHVLQCLDGEGSHSGINGVVAGMGSDGDSGCGLGAEGREEDSLGRLQVLEQRLQKAISDCEEIEVMSICVREYRTVFVCIHPVDRSFVD